MSIINKYIINEDKYLLKLNEKNIIYHDNYKDNQRIIIFENNDTLIIFDNDNIYNFFYKINDDAWDEYYFKYFDFKYYSTLYPNEQFNDWNEAFIHWFKIGRLQNKKYNIQSKLYINNTPINIVVNHTHKHIINLNENIFYKFEVKNGIFYINFNYFTKNGTTLTYKNIFDFIRFFKKNNNNEFYELLIFKNNSILCDKNTNYKFNNNLLIYNDIKYINIDDIYTEINNSNMDLINNNHKIINLISPQNVYRCSVDEENNYLLTNNLNISFIKIENNLIVKIDNKDHVYKKYNSNNYLISKINFENKKMDKLISNDDNLINIYNSWFCYDNEDFCYIIDNIPSGGSNKYLNDIINNYYEINFINIINLDCLKYIQFKQNNILILQNLLFIDIKIHDIIDLVNKYNLRLIIPLHNFYWVNNHIKDKFDATQEWENNYLKENIQIHPDIIKLFNIAKKIICPSKFVFDIYTKYFNTSNFLIEPHNDININNTNNYLPKIKNKTINIANLNSYSYCKGSNIIDYLKTNFKEYKSYKLNYLILQQNLDKYNENEYFNILKQNNTHLLTFLNNYGETYCYSLSKALQSGLPIIYHNIGSYKERISKNPKYFKINECDSLIENKQEIKKILYKSLDYIILNNGLNNNLIENYQIKFNDYYNNLFIKKKYNIVMISSKIIISNNSIQFTNNRSLYSVEERFNQTLETINSIKKYIPDYYIILFDNSYLNNEMYLKLKQNVNIFINITDNKKINYCTNKHKNKGIGEIIGIKYMLKYVDEIRFKNLFKISGRYVINEKFDYEKLEGNNNVFKKNNDIDIENFYYTSFYKISNKNYNKYKKCIDDILNENLKINNYEPLEVLLSRYLNYNFELIDNFGITERIAIINYITEI